MKKGYGHLPNGDELRVTKQFNMISSKGPRGTVVKGPAQDHRPTIAQYLVAALRCGCLLRGLAALFLNNSPHNAWFPLPSVQKRYKSS